MAIQHHLSVAGLASLLLAAHATPSLASEQGRGFIHLPVRTARNTAGFHHFLRRGYSALNFSGSPEHYTVPISIGTPAQEVVVDLDSGSADFWVNPKCENAGPLPGSRDACESAGVYDPSKSTTASSVNGTGSAFSTGFSPFSGDVDLDFYQDTVSLAGLTIPSQLVGVASDSRNETYGKLGLGPHPTDGFSDNLFISSVAKQGSISSRAFSLYLHPIDDATNGSFILGGLDRSKYEGGLVKLPIIPPSGSPTKTWANTVALSDFSVYLPPFPDATSYPLPQTVSGGGTAVVLDSASPVIGLPDNVTSAIYEQFSATPDTTSVPGLPLQSVTCALRGADGFFNFGFGGEDISVPVREVVLDGALLGVSGKCFLLVYPSGDVPVLGAPFLRAAYAVFDWDNQDIYLARAATCGTDIVAIGSGPDAVPVGNGNCTPSPRKKKIAKVTQA